MNNIIIYHHFFLFLVIYGLIGFITILLFSFSFIMISQYIFFSQKKSPDATCAKFVKFIFLL